jgi:Tfp pilus assembly protein PilX
MNLLQRLRLRGLRLSDESGIALIMAILIVLVLTIMVTSALAFTSSNSRDASRSSAGQKAYAAAEAGLNDGLAAAQNAGTDTTLMPGCGSPTVTSLSGGATASWCGSYNAATKVWTITATGAIANPTGPNATAISRTLSQTATIVPPPYNFVALDTGCDVHTLIVDSSGQLNVTNAIYVNSCNGIPTGQKPDAFDIFAGGSSGGNISAPSIQVVGGWETDGGNTPNPDTVTVKGVRCSLAKGNNPVTSAQPASCPQTGQPVVPDPFTAPGTPVNYSPQQTLSSAMTATQTTISASGTAIKTGDVIQVDNELMLVTTTGVQRGYFGTTATAHASGTVIKNVPLVSKITSPTLGSPACSPGTASSPAPCVIPTGTVTLQPGTYYGGICIGAATGTTCGSNIGGSCQSGPGPGPSAYSPNVTLSSSVSSTTTSIPVTWSGRNTPDPVAKNDVIQIGSEQMLVTSAPTGSPSGSNSFATLTVTRPYNGTSRATHSSGTTVYQVPPLVGTAHVTLAPGTYVIAGGGLFLCGLSTLSAPNVLIYNTQDPSHTSGSGAIDQFEINTTGSVSLGPQTSGPYEGLTYLQDRNLAVAPNDTCVNKTYFNLNSPPNLPTQAQINEYDVALLSMASSGSNGALGSVSGSFYGPANTTTFADSVSGTANLAVLTSCILINGGNSTFNFQPTGLFGTSWVIGPQTG